MSRGLVEKFPVSWLLSEAGLSSPHSGILVKIGKTQSFPPVDVIDWSKFDWELYKRRSKTALDGFYDRLTNDLLDPSDAVEALSSCIKDVVSNIAVYKKVTSFSRPWMDKEASSYIDSLRAARKRYRSHRSALNRERLDTARSKATVAIKSAKEKFLLSETQKIPKVGEKEKWNIINKLTSSASSPSVQPIKVELEDGSSTYAFEDAEIRSLMEEYHIKQLSETQRKEFHDQVTDLKNEALSPSTATLDPESSASHDLMNKGISLREVVDTFGSSDGSPGPDNVSAKLLDKADRDAISSCILVIFNRLWDAGIFPRPWKKEIRAILAKLGKESYHHCDSFRTISLTNVLGKRFEKVSCRRLVSILEHQGFDPFQFAYLKERSATQAVTLFTESISSGHNQGKVCGSVFFDFKDAFGSVNRVKLLSKLADKFGVSGKLFLHLCDFLSDRSANLKIDGDLGEWLQSDFGTAAGTVLGPILFIVDIHDVPRWVKPKFADDLSGIAIEDSVVEVEHRLQQYVTELVEWSESNDLPLNFDKIKVMLFYVDGVLNIQARGVAISQVDMYKLLGIWIDKMLSFRPHAEKACAKAMGAFLKISCLFLGRKGLSVKIGIQVYVALSRSLVEYAVPAWWFQAFQYLPLFQDMQYQCLRSVCGAFKNSSARALEVITGIQPVKLRFKDLCMREWVRIKSLDFFHPLYQCLGQAEAVSSRSTPLGFLAAMCEKFQSYLHINNFQITQRFVLSPEAISNQRIFDVCDIYANADIGSSGSRTDSQKAVAVSEMEVFLKEKLSQEAVIVFCDGSAKKGCCGSAAVVITNDNVLIEESRVISSDNVEAEVDGLRLAFSAIDRLSQNSTIKQAFIITDCEAALEIVKLQRDFSRWGRYFKQIWHLDDSLKAKSIKVTLGWCPSHCGIRFNEMADIAAKEACQLPIPKNIVVEIPFERCKTMIAEIIKKEWQRGWKQSNTGDHTKEILPDVGTKIEFSSVRCTGISICRALLNNAGVKDNLFRLGLADSPNCPSCVGHRETVFHVLLHCKRLAVPRRLLESQLSRPLRNLSDFLCPNLRGWSKSQKITHFEYLHAFMKNLVF